MGKRPYHRLVAVCTVIGAMSLATTCTTLAQVGTPTAASYSDTGFSASTAYRCQMRATDAAGNLSAYSSVVSATAQVIGGDGLIPADRMTTWNPGLNSVGGIPNRTTICATVNAFTYDNGTTDATAGIQAAIDACPEGQVVQLSAGDFRINSAIMISNGITLRGQGRSQTKLKMPVGTNDNTITIGGSQWTSLTQSRNLTANAAKGGYSVALASNPGLTVGEIVLLDQLTNSALTTWGASCPAGSACRSWFTRTNRPIGQVVEIASISGNVITFTAPLHIDFTTASTAQLSRFVDSSNGQIITAAKYAGIENLYVSGGGNNQIRFNIAAYSWMKGVESDNHMGHSVDIAASFRCEVRDSYIHSAQESVPGGGAYGLAFVNYSSDNLAENNIVRNMNKVMVMEASGGGNVIADNYMEDGWITYNTDWMETGLNASHMTTPHMELFEGNQAFNMDGDNTWGNAIYITALRNHLTGRRRGISPVATLSDSASRRAVGLMEGHWWYTFVGNVLGYSGQSPSPSSTFAYEDTYPWDDEPVAMWRLGYNPEDWNAVADPKVLSTLIRGGNYDYVTNQVHWDNVTQQDLPDSLYLTSKPAFFGSYAWPWVDPAGATKLYTLPARYCFDQGLMPDCVSGGGGDTVPPTVSISAAASGATVSGVTGNTSAQSTRASATTQAPPSSTWVQPIGVPIPSFGVAETIPANPSPWNASNNQSSGYAFYYICPSCSGATDTSNAYGYPGKAHVSMPGSVNASAVIMLDGQIDTDMSFTGNGTAASPIFVTSYNIATPSKLTVAITPQGSYIILDHLWLGPQNASDVDFGFWLSEGAHHIALRHSELAGNLNRAGGVGLGTWSYSGSQYVSNIVIDNNYIHNLGDTSATSDQDAHCVTLNGSENDIWVTHNRFEYCGGDSMQVEAQRNRRAFIHHIYYGQNTSYHNRQSGGWVKNATDVIFSQNVAHDFRDNSGGPGICYGFQYDAEYVWFLFNEGYQCNIGIGISGSDVSPGLYAFVIGNIIHDTQSQNPTDVYNAGAMVIRGGTNVYVVNNTMYNVDAGVNMPPGTRNVYYDNNIIANRTNAASYDLYTEGSAAVDAKNNVFGTNARFSGATAGTNALLADPQFVNPAGNDYHLQSTSPARDAGILSTVYATFQSRYGIDISNAYDGVARPQGSAWDIGAYEYQAGGGDTTPPTVSLTAPTAGATVSGAVTVSATASDNVGVAGVQFKLDGANLGTEDTTSPYSITWSTTSTTNGTHTLSASARDAAGNQGTATNVSVTVSNAAPGDTTAPFVPTGLSATAISSSQIDLAWTASTDNVAVTGYRIYRGGTQVGTSATHSYSDTGLTASTAYSYTVSAYDAAGNNSAQSTSASATTQALADTTAPVLSSVLASSITQTGANITWTTNENATTQVDYGLTTSYGSQTSLVSTLLTSHSASLSGLSAGTTYHYRVRSADGAGNLALSADFSLQTPVPPDTTAPSAVSNLATVNPTTNAATVTWTTNEPATAEVRYGLTSVNLNQTVSVGTLQTAQSVALTGLSRNTTYYYQSRSTDAAAIPANTGASSAHSSGAHGSCSASPSPRRSSRRLTRGTMVASTSATSAVVKGGRGQKRTPAPSLANAPSTTSACTWMFRMS